MERDIKKLAAERQLPVYQPESVNTPEGVAGVRAFDADLLVVAAYGQILSADVLNAARLGGINVHASLLPKYRGAAPINWAIYHGETETGVTIIRMSTTLDAGDMLAQEAIPILPDETTGELQDRLAPLGARLALQVIEQLEKGVTTGVKQNRDHVTKAPKLKKEHGLIDWSRSAEGVCHQIRAMQPWPTAYTFWHPTGKPPIRVQILKAAPVPDASTESPGVIAHVAEQSVRVACAAGQVSLIEIQPAGKKPMGVADFLRGHRLLVGERMGVAHG
jgi:methionyl-tRNA formyltransferase